MKSVASLTGGMLDISTCNQWYMYEFSKEAKSEDRDFFGYNDGSPWLNPESSGILKNVNSYTCREIEKSTPYFV
jgi:hypothetical protein